MAGFPGRRVYQGSGIESPEVPLPDKFEPNPPPSSPMHQHLQVAPDFVPNVRREGIISARPRMAGIRHLYARGASQMPIQPLGAGGGDAIGQAVWVSDFQPDIMGPIHNAGFNDKLFQAGYPGFNLGLSFKVQTLPVNPTGGTAGMRMRGAGNPVTRTVNPLIRSSGRPIRKGDKNAS